MTRKRKRKFQLLPHLRRFCAELRHTARYRAGVGSGGRAGRSPGYDTGISLAEPAPTRRPNEGRGRAPALCTAGWGDGGKAEQEEVGSD